MHISIDEDQICEFVSNEDGDSYVFIPIKFSFDTLHSIVLDKVTLLKVTNKNSDLLSNSESICITKVDQIDADPYCNEVTLSTNFSKGFLKIKIPQEISKSTSGVFHFKIRFTFTIPNDDDAEIKYLIVCRFHEGARVEIQQVKSIGVEKLGIFSYTITCVFILFLIYWASISSHVSLGRYNLFTPSVISGLIAAMSAILIVNPKLFKLVLTHPRRIRNLLNFPQIYIKPFLYKVLNTRFYFFAAVISYSISTFAICLFLWPLSLESINSSKTGMAYCLEDDITRELLDLDDGSPLIIFSKDAKDVRIVFSKIIYKNRIDTVFLGKIDYEKYACYSPSEFEKFASMTDPVMLEKFLDRFGDTHLVINHFPFAYDNSGSVKLRGYTRDQEAT